MLQDMTRTKVEDSVYSFIGDVHRVTVAGVAEFLRVDEGRANVWLRSQVAGGYLHRDEFGVYGTSCPWPRMGF